MNVSWAEKLPIIEAEHVNVPASEGWRLWASRVLPLYIAFKKILLAGTGVIHETFISGLSFEVCV